MRTVLGIILLVVCILLVGVAGLHFFIGTSQRQAVWLDETGFASRMSPEMPFHTRTVSSSITPFFVLIGLGFLVLVLGGLGLVLLCSGRGSKSAKGLNGEETRIVQEIHDGLSRMEKRVEALETILLERSSKQEV